MNDAYKDVTAAYDVRQRNIDEYDAFIYDDKPELFNFVSIQISTPDKNSLDIKSALVHELTHAYEDYNRHKKSSFSIYKYLIFYDYEKKMKHRHHNEEELFIKEYEYYLSDIEQNAYIAQLCYIIKYHASSLHSIRELYEFIYRRSEIFRRFLTFYHNYKYYVNHNTEWNKIYLSYNEMNNTKFSSDKIYKIMSRKIHKFRYKLYDRLIKTWQDNA